MSEPAIRVSGLVKNYGEFTAVDGIDLEVGVGEVFAFLGPNGAGKTTTVETLEGYRDRTEGEVTVLGIDPAEANRGWRERIGIVLQECEMQPQLTVRETLDLYAGYYREPRGVDETIEVVGLEEKAEERAGKLSGGQQRRLDVAIALIGDAELLFLDEPTTGCDPQARRQTWTAIANLKQLGKTIFLTTHYMDEAQFLADRVAIIADGKIVAEGAPDELGGRATAATVITFRLPAGVEASRIPEAAGAPTVVGSEVELAAGDPTRALNHLTGWAIDQGIELSGLTVARPSLEDVYLSLTEEPPE
ncbi:ABC transporter ATP-binding protein [soil metagenome]